MTGDHLRRQDNREAEVAQQVKSLLYKCDDCVNPQHLYKYWAGAAIYLETQQMEGRNRIPETSWYPES